MDGPNFPPDTGNLEAKLAQLKEAFDKHEQVMEAFHQSQTQSIKHLSSQVSALRLKMETSSSSNAAALPRIEFPRFCGQDFRGWLYKCNQFFQLFSNIPDDSKVKLASIHLDGEALRWHTKFMAARDSESVVKWEEYVQEMEVQFGGAMPESGAKESESAHLIETRKPRRRICKLRQIQESRKSRPRFGFGPIYFSKGDSSAKEEAWQIVLENSPGGSAATEEIYVSAIRRIEKSARDCYADGAADHLTGSQFRRMMIMDGCFFLQLALYVLGGSQQLGYPSDHAMFVKTNKSPRFRDVKDWIEAMFFVGNQIPLVVLKKLMKQHYFQKVIKEGKWEQPSELSRKALYELLLLPELEDLSPIAWRAVKGLWGKVSASRMHWLQQQQPTDLLHGLQLLVLGPELDQKGEEEEEEDIDDDEQENQDLEAQHEQANSSDAIDETISSSATDLKQAGIHFLLSRGIGSRGIRFTNTMFLCHGYPILHLPPILMEDDTELMFQCLRNYEMSQKLDASKREVCSYLRFMSELIRTPDDAKLITDNGIVQGKVKRKHKLPGILRGLTSKETYNQNLRIVKLKISDYSPPIWKKYWHIISFGLIITLLQTVYTILPYYKNS
ncbi:hypothetical protein Salat_1554700 [Sesamum alatum]|uniref:Retrotransposon gag domain-containing protein n=1 Tax=Sesamum alatum TaxID=300844 RepID=A0AAE1YD74_9LAMI|nr:hypothetical protein Salat_1554700 [Sesamum alatum]